MKTAGGIKSNPAQQQSLPERQFRQDRKRVFDFIRPRVSTQEDAEDLLQDVFFQYIVNYNATRPLETATAWLLTVARNKIIDWYRARRATHSPVLLDVSDEKAFAESEIAAQSADNPHSSLEADEFWSCLMDALDSLPSAQREVFIKHELEGFSFKEISAETGISVNALISRKHDAVVRLRILLQEIAKH